jgi:hypothetical protein
MSYEELAVNQQAGLIMQARDRLYRGRRTLTVLFLEYRSIIKISFLRLNHHCTANKGPMSIKYK